MGFGRLLHGWTLATQGNGTEGCEQIRQGLATLQAMGTVIGTRSGVALLAEAYSLAGQVEEGLMSINAVLPTVDPRGERFWDAELYRVKGDLLLAQEGKNQKAKVKKKKSKTETSPQPLTSSIQEAEACFLKAIDIAQRQQARSWELRAAMSLARLWKKQGKRKEAHQMLAEVYGWFAEGFDTKDLQEAKTLLEELG